MHRLPGSDSTLLVKFNSLALLFSDHVAAVKAIAWSPHQHGLLASGGGTADKCIRFWNTVSGTPISCVDTGSQVRVLWQRGQPSPSLPVSEPFNLLPPYLNLSLVGYLATFNLLFLFSLRSVTSFGPKMSMRSSQRTATARTR